MSVAKRQSFKYSIVGYFGVLVGFLSTYFLFPYDFKFYGKLRYILTTAEILTPIVVFGVSYANVKFFHWAKKQDRHQNLLFLSLLMIIANFLLFVVGFWIFYSCFPEYQNSELWSLKKYILPLVLLLSLSAIFNKYISNYQRIAVSNIFQNLFPKMGNILAFTLVLFLGFSEFIGILFFIGMFVLALLGYVLYANRLERLKPNFSTAFIKKDKAWKRILDYSFFGFLGNLGNYIAVRIDSYMIGENIGFEENGIYLVLFSMISLMAIPQMGLYNISAPIINEKMENNQMQDLDKFHKKTSLSLFFVGAVLFSCLVVGFPYLVHFIKNGDLLLQNQPIIWVLGLATLFDLATGFNGNIISMSKYYRINIFFMLALATLTIVLNLYFIKNTDLGILGVAIATATSDTKLIFWTLIYKVMLCLGVIVVGNQIFNIFPIREYLNRKLLK